MDFGLIYMSTFLEYHFLKIFAFTFAKVYSVIFPIAKKRKFW